MIINTLCQKILTIGRFFSIIFGDEITDERDKDFLRVREFDRHKKSRENSAGLGCGFIFGKADRHSLTVSPFCQGKNPFFGFRFSSIQSLYSLPTNCLVSSTFLFVGQTSSHRTRRLKKPLARLHDLH